MVQGSLLDGLRDCAGRDELREIKTVLSQDNVCGIIRVEGQRIGDLSTEIKPEARAKRETNMTVAVRASEHSHDTGWRVPRVVHSYRNPCDFGIGGHETYDAKVARDVS